MNFQAPKTTVLLFFLIILKTSVAQNIENNKTALPDTTIKKPANSFIISAEMRMRSEFRHGYRLLAVNDTSPAFFINQRTRLNFDFKNNSINLFASLQDARVWGQQDGRTPTLPVYLFEGFAEPVISKQISVRIGRQRIIYDNQRLFAENEWRLTGMSHDAVRFIYKKANITTEVIGAFNQSNENFFTTVYKPAGFSNYKSLFVHYLNWNLGKKIELITLNVADTYQNNPSANVHPAYTRFTSGGRLSYTTKKWYATISAYYQYGKDSAGLNLRAYYLQPEVKFSGFKNLLFRIGMEYLSGNNGRQSTSTNNNFVPLYGVAHRFMGNLDFFTAFPADVKNAGLVNPYFFIYYEKKNLLIRMENHLFYSQNNYLFQNDPIKKYLGFENDWRLQYKANNFTNLEFGFCWARVTNSMTIIKSAGDPSKTPVWSYLSVKFATNKKWEW